MKLSKAKGCILGVAIGDALGAPVEFDSIESIKSKYGNRGVTTLARWGGFPAGSYTDDTQMSMATARGIIQAGGSEEINIIRIPTIGEGWTGEEALGIALYCALRFEHDFWAGVLVAVNNSGDSDSTGSITGAILGARLGIEAIPKDWVERVENSQEILQIAEELFRLRGKITGGAAT